MRASILLVPTLLLISATAHGADAGANPCDVIDLTNLGSCKIEVSSGCKANCTWVQEALACFGKCNVSASQSCVDTCGVPCIQMCNPQFLDCFKGCHDECDAPTADLCRQKGETDCTNRAKAHCDNHCKDSCKVPSNSCQEHCDKCCRGGCKTQINIDCDLSCFNNINKDCGIQCSKPDGAIFCGGNYIHATDITACLSYLAQQGIKVDVSARGNLKCDATGCKGIGSACAASPGDNPGLGAFGAFVGMLAITAIARRRRNRS